MSHERRYRYHVAHCESFSSLIQFMQVNTLIIECWATACEWKITKLEFESLGISGVEQSYQDYRYFSDPFLNVYTPLFIDLEDNFDQNPNNNASFSLNKINCYNLGYIQQNVMKDVYGLTSLKNTLMSQKPSNISTQQIDENLQYYFNNF